MGGGLEDCRMLRLERAREARVRWHGGTGLLLSLQLEDESENRATGGGFESSRINNTGICSTALPMQGEVRITLRVILAVTSKSLVK